MSPSPSHDPEVAKTRVQLDLSVPELQRFNWIMETCDFSTRKELFNNALTMLEWAAKETVSGKKIAAFDDATKERYILSMPALSAAASQTRTSAPQKGRPLTEASIRQGSFAKA